MWAPAIVIGFTALLLAGGAACVWNLRRRATMTPVEREADDADDRREAGIW